MRKVFSFILAALALCAFNSCDKQEQVFDDAAVKFNGPLVFKSAKPEVVDDAATKTVWTGSSVQWQKDDKIRIGFTFDGEWQSSGKETDVTPRFYASDALKENADIASFSVPFGNNSFQETMKSLEGEIIFYGVYPSSLIETGQADAPNLSISIPAEQKPSSNSFAASADILIGQTETLEKMTEDPILMNWTRIVALGDITLKNLDVPEGENLLRLTLTAQEGADLVGDHTLNVENCTVSNPVGATNEIVVNVSDLTISSENTIVLPFFRQVPSCC